MSHVKLQLPTALFTLHTSRFTLRTSHFSLHSSHSTLHASHSTLHTRLPCTRWSRCQPSPCMTRSYLRERQFWGISCRAQGCLKVCGSCTGIVWTQNPGSCHSSIPCTKWMRACWTWSFKIVRIAKKGGSGLQQGEARVAYRVASRAKLSKKQTFAELLKKNWLEPSRPICENCLHEAKRACQGAAAEGTFSVDGGKSCRPRIACQRRTR